MKEDNSNNNNINTNNNVTNNNNNSINENDEAEFNWEEYLKKTNSEAAPKSCFRQHEVPPINEFEIGQKLETDDPRNRDSMCIGTVVGKKGPRIRLRLDGTDDRNDFWLLVDSEYIHPFEYTTKRGGVINPPLGFRNNISTWPKFFDRLVQSASENTFARDHCFKIPPPKPSINEFKRGQKLEAVDQKNPSLICPATIKDIDKENIYISFDGWSQGCNFWCHYASRDIFPVGWCKLANHPLEYPGYSNEKRSNKSNRRSGGGSGANTSLAKESKTSVSNQRKSIDNETSITTTPVTSTDDVPTTTTTSETVSVATTTKTTAATTTAISESVSSTSVKPTAAITDTITTTTAATTVPTASTTTTNATLVTTPSENGMNTPSHETTSTLDNFSSSSSSPAVNTQLNKMTKNVEQKSPLKSNNNINTTSRHNTSNCVDLNIVKNETLENNNDLTINNKRNSIENSDTRDKLIHDLNNHNHHTTHNGHTSEHVNKSVVYVNSKIDCSKYLNSAKFHTNYKQFGPDIPKNLFKLILQAFINCAIDSTKIFDLIQDGDSTSYIKFRTAQRNERKHLPKIENESQLWTNLKLMCKLFLIDENLFVKKQLPSSENKTNTTTIATAASAISNAKLASLNSATSVRSKSFDNTINAPKQVNGVEVESNLNISQSTVVLDESVNINGHKMKRRSSSDDSYTQNKLKKFDLHPNQWDMEQVGNYVLQTDPNLAPHVDVLKYQEIDGKAFLLLTTDVMMKYMGLKLGPALKLSNLIENLKRRH